MWNEPASEGEQVGKEDTGSALLHQVPRINLMEPERQKKTGLDTEGGAIISNYINN